MAGVGKGSCHLSPPDSASGLPASATSSIPLGFFGSIMNDPYAVDYPEAMIAAVRWTYVPIQSIGSFSGERPPAEGREKLWSSRPEFMLIAALLDDAVTIIRDGRERLHHGIPFPKDSPATSESVFYEAVRWVLGLDKMEDGQFSFGTVCDYLGLDPDVAREALLYGPIEDGAKHVLDSGKRRRRLATRGCHNVTPGRRRDGK